VPPPVQHERDKAAFSQKIANQKLDDRPIVHLIVTSERAFEGLRAS
jgi:hypothetical protein